MQLAGLARAGFQVFAIPGLARQANPAIHRVLIEADPIFLVHLHQRSPDQQWFPQHQDDGLIAAQFVRPDFTVTHPWRAGIEPFRHRQIAKERSQTRRRPLLGEQALCLYRMPGGRQQHLLFGVVDAAGLFVKEDGGHPGFRNKTW